MFARNIRISRSLLIILILLCSQVRAEEDTVYVPASFTNDPGALRYQIEFPEVEADVNVYIKCAANVDLNGFMLNHICLSKPDDESDLKYVEAINRPISRALDLPVSTRFMKPAIVNGDKKIVWFQYTVQFFSYSNTRIINVFPNHMLNTKLYGDHYFAPQVIRSYKERRFLVNNRLCGKSLSSKIFWVGMLIDKSGAPQNITLSDEDTPEPCKKFLMQWIGIREYIPAFHEGQPVDATYIDVFFSRNSSAVNKRR